MRATRPDRQRGAGSRARYRPRGGYRARAAGRRAARRSPRSSRALRLPRAPRSARSFQTTLNQPDQSALRSRGENHQRLQFGSTNRQNRPQLWFQHRRTRAALSAPLRVDVAVMAAARGTPGASLVTLVTASLRDARPGGGRGEEEREGEARGRADTCISERYASGPTSAGATTPSPAARARARRPRGVRVILRARIRGDAGRGSRARRRAARARARGTRPTTRARAGGAQLLRHLAGRHDRPGGRARDATRRARVSPPQPARRDEEGGQGGGDAQAAALAARGWRVPRRSNLSRTRVRFFPDARSRLRVLRRRGRAAARAAETLPGRGVVRGRASEDVSHVHRRRQPRAVALFAAAVVPNLAGRLAAVRRREWGRNRRRGR